jgi:hypothetical protein
MQASNLNTRSMVMWQDETLIRRRRRRVDGGVGRGGRRSTAGAVGRIGWSKGVFGGLVAWGSGEAFSVAGELEKILVCDG